MNPTPLKVEGLTLHYRFPGPFGIGGATLKAVDGVSFELKEGEILGVVGESGCGKSSLARAILRLVEPTSGKVEICGQNFLSLKGDALRTSRSQIQMVFQDPYGSLDSRMTVKDILVEPLQAHFKLSSADMEKRAVDVLDRVGLASKNINKYPHEFSGGQRQRVAIARALILKPKIIIADEPVSSLDVSVQAQILNLLKDIQRDMKLSMVFISHNLAVVRYLVDRVAVMYLGKIVETSATGDLFAKPLHPYTQALLSCVPVPDPNVERNKVARLLTGEIPSPLQPPPGCTFHTRCPKVQPHCKLSPPALETKSSLHSVSCFEVK